MSSTSHYSALDRILHDAAFAGMSLQKAVADVEDAMFGSELAAIDAGAPVFICSLPRAGTTLVLEILNRLPTFATHTYRHMPFLLCPMLWDRISRGFRREATLSERAHGDGIEIGYDSPEAFEEAIWRAFWSAKYGPENIALWTAADSDADFEEFLVRHLRKIVAVRRNREARACRYVSKNNGNIARLGYLKRLFPDGRFIVPVREPLSHVRSLHRQHMQFTATHREDAFARRYMSSIGHFDFGENLKPIAFPGGPSSAEDADKPGFWLEYWIAAFTSLEAERSQSVMFMSYEGLCISPEPALEAMLRHIGEAERGRAAGLAAFVREGAPKQPVAEGVDPARLALARDIYHRLIEAH